MSAVLVGELVAPELSVASRRCRVGYSAPVVRASEARIAEVVQLHPARPAVSRAGGAESWQLTDRGIAVVMAFFVGLFVVGVAVLVGGFLAVSDEPQFGPGVTVSVAGNAAG